MGRSLDGKNLGMGLTQRKDGRFSARFTDKTGVRREKIFVRLRDARTWLNHAKAHPQATVGAASESTTPSASLLGSRAKREEPFRVSRGKKLSRTNPFSTKWDNRPLTLNEWFEEWSEKEKSRIRESTYRNYVSKYERMAAPFIGDKWLFMIREKDLDELNDKLLEKGYARCSVSDLFVMLRRVLRDAKKKGLMTEDLSDFKTRLPDKRASRTETKRVKVLDKTEIEKLNRVLNVKDPNDNAVLLVLETGLRIGELRALTWQDVNLKEGFIRVTHAASADENGKTKINPPKTEAGYRVIPLTRKGSELLEIMWIKKEVEKEMLKDGSAHSEVKDIWSKGESQVYSYKDEVTDRWVTFTGNDLVYRSKQTGGIKTTHTFDQTLKKRAQMAEIPHVSMHSLRHTFATRLANSGAAVKSTQTVMGHETSGITLDVYMHSTDSQLKKDIHKLDSE